MSSTETSLRAIVFDFDGVILESADVKTEAFVALYAEHGESVVERVRAHHLANLGLSRFKKFEWIAENVFRTRLSESEKARLGTRFSELALDGVLKAPFVAGAEAALRRLAEKLPLFVASGTPHEELELIVERRGIAPRFREVHGTPTEKPQILRDLMARHGLAPREVLFVGDGLTDYKAAVATGVEFLARDTPPFHDEWVKLGVRREPDLNRLEELASSW